jgi:hypothetical protein
MRETAVIFKGFDELSATPGPRRGQSPVGVTLVSLEARLVIELIYPSTIVMHFLRRSKSSEDIPASVPAFSANLVRRLTSQRKPQSLVVSSASIALSIGSPFSNTRGTSTDGGTGRGSNSGWQTAYAAARMAVEIAKESSDMCLPLKAVVGAICALIQNCDVSVPRS